jgi:pSer/pThr/pTyr-binding forkhead associated (FHA) protein
MLAQLKIVKGPNLGRLIPLPRDQKIQLGRGAANLIRLDDVETSRVHCDILVEGVKATLTDANSAGGAWVNGLRITRHELQQGDLITVGKTELAFQWSDIDEKHTEAWHPGGDE